MILAHVRETIWRAAAASVLLVESRDRERPTVLSLDHNVTCLSGCCVILVAPWHLCSK